MSGCGNSKFKILLIGLGLFFLPFLSHAQVVINEVQLSPTSERFLELYNTSDSVVNLTGWYMQRKTATGSSFDSLVSNTNFKDKTIGSHDYFVISRNSLSSSNIVLSITLTESNTIQIKNSGGDVVDKIGWGSVSDCGNPCPSNPPDGQSIQRVPSGWIISSPTPGLINSTIPSSSSTTTPTATTTEETTNTNQNSSDTTTTQTTNNSVHYSSVPLSNVIPQIAYKVGAGRSRLGCVGTPIEFKGESNADFNGFTNYKWSFGDGAIGYGHIVSHAYAYPGDYVVVLNAVSPAGQAISRTDVKIIPEDFVISDASPKRIEIKNNSKYEINLFGRAIQSEGRTFVFPEDTIIKVGQQISFPDSVTGLHPTNNNDVSMIVVGDSLNKSFVPSQSDPSLDKKKQILDLWSKAQNIKNQLLILGQINVATASVVGDSLPEQIVSASTLTKVAHQGWLQIVKDFFLGRK